MRPARAPHSGGGRRALLLFPCVVLPHVLALCPRPSPYPATQNVTAYLHRALLQGPLACHTICITEDGKCCTFGRNELGQLGHGDRMNRGAPTPVKALETVRITKAVAGKTHTLFLTSGGEVWACGSNKFGELGQVTPHSTPATRGSLPLSRWGGVCLRVAGCCIASGAALRYLGLEFSLDYSV
jgi:hypothetical protein